MKRKTKGTNGEDDTKLSKSKGAEVGLCWCDGAGREMGRGKDGEAGQGPVGCREDSDFYLE